MLDMGFIPDVEKIVSLLPANRQTLFFSATMAPEIRRLADAFLQNPKEVAVSRAASVATTITEGLALVSEIDKREALRRLIRKEEVQNALIFCNRKRDVDILYKSLGKHGFSVGALHGDMAQPARFATLEKFKAGELRLLCCSDVAARGIDIGGLSHVFNFDVPHHSEDYVHRIGRTGRAGREGRAFTLAAPEDRQNVEAIEKLIGHPIPRIAIDGLDEVTWAEGDGRRRGRGRGAPWKDAKPERAPAKAKSGEKRDDDKRGRPERKERAERPTTPVEIVAAPLPPPDVVREMPVAAEPAPRRERERDRDHNRGRPRRDERRDERHDDRRDDRRDRREREDLGPRVVGFGDEIPAFMLIAARKRAPISEDLSQTEELEC